jgi:hypothetical protein
MTTAAKWFAAGLNQHGEFAEAWQQARCAALSAGMNFLKARSCCENGGWLELMQSHAHRIKPRTVQFYMQFATAALEWAKEAEPALEGAKLEQFCCQQVMLMSPKPLVALLRDLRLMRPFGEYDAVQYASGFRQQHG